MTRYNNLWMNNEQQWVVGVGFNLPFDFGKRSSREDSLRAEQMALRWEKQDLFIQLREQLVQADSYFQQAKSVHQLYQNELLPLADENLITARNEYRSGHGDFLSLLTAQRQTLETQRKEQMAIREQHAQFAQLTAAAGLVQLKDWHAILNLDVFEIIAKYKRMNKLKKEYLIGFSILVVIITLAIMLIQKDWSV